MKGRPLVLGHRGYRARHPENTLRAFRAALAAGADGVECDIQKTADGRYAVIHDPTVDRVTGTLGRVDRMSFAELRALDAGSAERIPELRELLALLPAGAYLDLELKEETITPEDFPALHAILGGPRPDLMISSFEASLLVPFRANGYTIGFLVGDRMVSRGAGAIAALLVRLRPQYLNLPIQMLERIGAARSKILARALRLLGFSLLFWTVNDRARAATVRPFARILVTDEVEALVE
jgi:glycerophosphoryl diester phosphodiesterase